MQPKIENSCQTEKKISVNLGEPVLGTDRRNCERILKATEGLCCS